MLQDDIVTAIICTHMTHKQTHILVLCASSCSLTHLLSIIHKKIHKKISDDLTVQEAHIQAVFPP